MTHVPRCSVGLIACTILVMLIPAERAAAQYAYTPLNLPYGAKPLAINDAGTIVGSYYFSGDGSIHGFTCSTRASLGCAEGYIQIVDYPGSFFWNELTGINDSGVMTGSWCDRNSGHGFFGTSPSNFASFDVPGEPGNCLSILTGGINDLGVVTGTYWDANGVGHGFTYNTNNGQSMSLDYPGASVTTATSINDSGSVVGQYGQSSYPWINFEDDIVMGVSHFWTPTLNIGGNYTITAIDNSGDWTGWGGGQGFIAVKGQVIPVFPPGNSSSGVWGTSPSGNYLFGYADVTGYFLASAYALLDPYPYLMNGPSVSAALLASQGLSARVVDAVAADGVTEVVVRIPAANMNDQISITLLNDKGQPSSSSQQDGGLWDPTNPGPAQNQVTVSAITVSGQPFAFAVYQAPVDFARQNPDKSYMTGTCNGGNPPSGPDNLLQCRAVSLQISDQTSGASGTLPVTILRPPVVLIHGLWSNPNTWNGFALATSKLFAITRADYSGLVGPLISASSPNYNTPDLQPYLLTAQANSLGFDYNAGTVLIQVQTALSFFRYANNPIQTSAAAAQADLVAHSMGGDVTRAIALQPKFIGDQNFSQGYIHKLITIGTPHQGSAVANIVLDPNERAQCVERWLAKNSFFVFSSVVLSAQAGSRSGFQDGALGDLMTSSDELKKLARPGVMPIQTALIAAANPVFGGESALCFICSHANPPDTITRFLDTQDHWNLMFDYDDNDAIVSVTSALNYLPTDSGTIFQGDVHSAEAEGRSKLGWNGPALLEDPSVSTRALQLLNTFVTDTSVFFPFNP